MTARSIERLFTRLMWAICLAVIVRWLIIHKLDQGRHGHTLHIEADVQVHARAA